MADPTPTRRRFYPTPAWLISGLLVVEGLLWLSERFQWPTWHKGHAVLVGVASVAVVFVAMLFWLVVALVFRWRFQFSIRSLLALTVAIAIPCSWMAVEIKAAREQEEAVDSLEKFDRVAYDWQWDPTRVSQQPPEPEWLRKILGDDFFGTVVGMSIYDNKITDERLAYVARLSQLQLLRLNNTRITDAGLVHIEGLTKLKRLEINDTQITDAGLAHLAGLPHVTALSLDTTQITDVGMHQIVKDLPQVGLLSLDGTRITDAGLPHLAGLTTLQMLWIGDNPQITDAGVNRLQQALPNCTIIR